MIYLLKILISQFAMLNNQRLNPNEIPKSAMIFAGDTSEEPLCLAWDLACSARPSAIAVAAAPSGAGTGSGRRSFLGQGGAAVPKSLSWFITPRTSNKLDELGFMDVYGRYVYS